MPRPNAAIINTPFDAHGGPDGRVQRLLDFSVNSNPLGPPAGLLEQLSKVDLSSYPDPTAHQAKEAAAQKHARSRSEITLGNGAADLIHRLAACYLNAGSKVIIAAPTFGEYARASHLQEAKVVPIYPYREMEPNLEPVLSAIKDHRPTLVFVCHPNNPTGHAWTESQLCELAQVCREKDALLVLDLAYLSLSDAPETALPESTMHLYSLTKSFTIPGVRVGYVVAPAEVVQALERSAPPWQTGTHALTAAVWALSPAGDGFLSESVPPVLGERRRFQMALRALELEVLDTLTTFFLCEVGDGTAFKEEAQRSGFRVRDTSSFGLPHHVRLATRRPEENAQLLDWLKARG